MIVSFLGVFRQEGDAGLLDMEIWKPRSIAEYYLLALNATGRNEGALIARTDCDDYPYEL